MKRVILPVLVLLLYLPGIAFTSNFSCTKVQAKERIRKVLFSSLNITNPLFKKNIHITVDETNRISFGRVTLCEVVFHIEPVDREKKKTPVQKFVFYMTEDLVFTGNLWKCTEKTCMNVTTQRLRDLNREYSRYMQERYREIQKRAARKERLKRLGRREFERLVKQSDMKFEVKNPEALVVSFIDPYCPHCRHMKELLLKKVSEGKISAYFIFTPISPRSEKIAASVICDKKTSKERLQAFNQLYVSEKICREGMEKVRNNSRLFFRLGGRGVPYSIMKKKNGEIKLIEGSVSENIFDSYLE